MALSLPALPADSPPQQGGLARASLRLGYRLFEPIDIASLVHFRIAFGAIMLWEVWRYFSYGWIGRYYVEPTFHFTYFGFDWVRPWPESGMYLHFAALGVLAVCIMLGVQYRIAAALFFLGFTYVFLLEQGRYLNHFYLICLLSLLVIFVPAHRAASFDAWRRPALWSETVPAWGLWLLRAQLGIVYFYGGLAKLNEDWLRGEPLRTWFIRDGYAEMEIVGPFFASEAAAYLFSYGGLLFDLLIVPLLLWRRTRMYAFAGVVAFNVLNAWLFSIGIFPWMMIAASLLFFAPDWPRRLDFGSGGTAREEDPPADDPVQDWPRSAPAALRPSQRLTLGLLAAYLVVQLLVPLRHLLYPSEVSWSEEGHLFSWHMKLRDKEAEARFFVTDPTANEAWEVDPHAYLTPWQLQKMSNRPDMILQFSHHLADELRGQGRERVEVRAQVMASLNGRPPQWLIDPTVDLAAQPRNLEPASWIVPLGASPTEESPSS